LLEGGERHEAFTYPDEEWFYYTAAEKFGWTPDQVDEQPAYLIDWLISIATLVDEVKAKQIDSTQPKTR
jgi:hypothetical protein